jgi:hypothetical protein
MSKLVPIIVSVMLLAAGLSARAQIILQNTVDFNGKNVSSDELSIAYTVTQTGDLYTYSYVLTTSPAVDFQSFTIGNGLDPVNTQSVVIQSLGGAFNAGTTSDSIIYQWAFNPGTTSADVSYTSPFAPTLATFTLTGGDAWGSPALIPAPAAVPETSTLLAGAMMVLPFGVSVYRSLRKDRRV